MLGKIVPDHFPHIFGPDANQPLDTATVRSSWKRWVRRLPRPPDSI